MSDSEGQGSKRILVRQSHSGPSQLVGGNVFPALAAAGLALLAVGLADLALTWYPLALGNREWEFGTITATLNGLPVVLMGTVFVYLAVADTGMVRATKLVGWACVAAVITILIMAVMYLLDVPLALNAVQGPLLTAIKKAIAKTLVQIVVYPVAFGFIGWRALRHFRVKEAS